MGSSRLDDKVSRRATELLQTLGELYEQALAEVGQDMTAAVTRAAKGARLLAHLQELLTPGGGILPPELQARGREVQAVHRALLGRLAEARDEVAAKLAETGRFRQALQAYRPSQETTGRRLNVTGR